MLFSFKNEFRITSNFILFAAPVTSNFSKTETRGTNSVIKNRETTNIIMSNNGNQNTTSPNLGLMNLVKHFVELRREANHLIEGRKIQQEERKKPVEAIEMHNNTETIDTNELLACTDDTESKSRTTTWTWLTSAVTGMMGLAVTPVILIMVYHIVIK